MLFNCIIQIAYTAKPAPRSLCFQAQLNSEALQDVSSLFIKSIDHCNNLCHLSQVDTPSIYFAPSSQFRSPGLGVKCCWLHATSPFGRKSSWQITTRSCQSYYPPSVLQLDLCVHFMPASLINRNTTHLENPPALPTHSGPHSQSYFWKAPLQFSHFRLKSTQKHNVKGRKL